MCYHCISISGTRVTRKDLGLPESWIWIENWLNDFEDVAQEAHEDSPPIELKNWKYLSSIVIIMAPQMSFGQFFQKITILSCKKQ